MNNPVTLMKTMRDVFIEAIYKKMAENDNIFFLSGDFGAPALDALKRDFKDRFINVGIAEQNLINIATGLALEGYTIYVYAIAPFLTMRAYEQIRLNLSISTHVKPVNINLIGVGVGVSYDVAGPTHHCLEDASIMRILPNMVVFSPSDWKLVGSFIDYSFDKKLPKYIRLDGKPVQSIYENVNDFDFEKGFYELVKGGKVCLITTGYSTHTALKVAGRLPGFGVIDVFMLKPFDEKSLSDALKKYTHVITIEEAFLNNGGLDCLISKVIRTNQLGIKLKNLGFDDKYVFDLGGRDYLHKVSSLDEESIIRAVQEIAE